MKKTIGVLAVAGLITTSALADTEITLKLPVEVHGGFSAGYSYEDSKNEGFEVTNFLIELSKEAETGDIGFTAAFGYLANNPATISFSGTVTYKDKYRNDNNQLVDEDRTGSLSNDSSFGLQYGYLTIKPIEGLTLDAGVLATMVGYEVANTYANPNITIARIWGGQPVYYGGARVTYSVMEGIDVFAEVNDDGNDGAWSLGSTGDLGVISYTVSYYDKNDPVEPDIIDVILSGTVVEDTLDVAVNFDYQEGQNDDGYGVALYVIPKFGNISIPVRFESFDDNGSGAYGNSGWDVAITPTYNFEHGYLRAEVFFYNYDYPETIVGTVKNKGYAGDDSNVVFRVEAGFTF